MLILGAAVCGFLLDLLLGDPEWMPHPVVLMSSNTCCPSSEYVFR